MNRWGEVMSELIYKDEAVAAISGLMKRGYMGQIALRDARIAIQAMTPVDAKPIKHGHWIDNGNDTISCSRCSTWFPKEREPYMNWCGYCGAKMGGE